MKSKTYFALTCAMALGASVSALAATKGSCEKDAQSLSGTKTVKLVKEYDDGEYDDSGAGVYYFKATLKRGNAYTVWTEGVSADSSITLEAYAAEAPEDKDVSEPIADFESVGEIGANSRLVMYADDWWIDDEDPEYSDPKSWTYYFVVEGNVGDSVTVNFSTGVSIPAGWGENPSSLSVSTTAKTFKGKLQTDGEYYFKVRLEAGGLYSFGTTGGSEALSLSIASDAIWNDDDGENTSAAVLDDYDDPAYADDEFNAGILVVPSKTADYNIIVQGMVTTTGNTNEVDVLGDAYGKSFGLVYRAYETNRKDDTAKGAVAWTLKNVKTSFTRTFLSDNPEDNFKITGKDGYLYDISLVNALGGNAVFSITNADAGIVAMNVTEVRRISLPATKTPYYLTVSHDNDKPLDGIGVYTLSGLYADVGQIAFAKTAVNVKENASYVEVAVNRMGKDGRVRVRYGTVADTAKPGVDYVAHSGVLEWANGDKSAKKIRVSLVPELVAVYDGVNSKRFAIQLEPMGEDELEEGEYPASLTSGKGECAVSITETSKAGTTVASTYAKKAAVKRATVKTENVPLETGSFYGVVSEDGSALTNYLPRLASVTFTASTAATPALSAKVAIGGKTYSFSAKGWDDSDSADAFIPDDDGEYRTRTLVQIQKSGKVAYTNTLAIAVREGTTTNGVDWCGARADIELTMNVPDAKGKGFQEEIVYRGVLYRNNAKIQDYLDVVTNFVGYYTVALASTVSVSDGLPAGNGYLTLTVDNKGGVKVAGMLADGATKPSLSVKGCAVVKDADSANGYALLVPVHVAKTSSYCVGGTLRLHAVEDERNPNESGLSVVVDSTSPFVWCTDLATATYDGEEGFALELAPCGGWYDKVANLQAYYLDYALSVGTANVDEFPKEDLLTGYRYVTEAQPDGFALELVGDKVSYDKKKIVKTGKQVDFEQSSNVCNVSVKLARATGLVTGGCSLWSVSADETKQKEVTGFKAYGALVLAREAASPLAEEILAAGFLTKKVKLTDVGVNGRKTTRTWAFSAPFNIMGTELDETDPWADDWGESGDE